MTDYNKLTVANLRQLLKERGIPSTGLTKKAQIVQKLEEQDQANNGAAEEPEVPATAPEAEQGDGVNDTQDEAAQTKGKLHSHLMTFPPGPPYSVTKIEKLIAPAAETASEPARGNEAGEPPAPDTTAAKQMEQPEQPSISAGSTQPENAEEAAPAPGPTDEQAPSIPAEPAQQPVENTQTTPSRTQVTDFAVTEKTPSPAPNERPSIEKPELLPIPERSANTSVQASRLNSEEVEADTRKRKRRSRSPEIPSQDVRAKKPRPSEDTAPVVHLKEDNDVVMEQRQPEDHAPGETKAEVANGVGDSEDKKAEEDPDSKDIPAPQGPKTTAAEKKEKGDRYKGLFNPTAPAHATDTKLDDRPIVPALHPATPAIYIRDFMRPLRLEALRSHLISIASPPSASPDESILKSLFIDQMKTHALVYFSSTTAASRVRASMHGSIWPPDSGQRKELWVDFIPEDKVLDWIQEEESAITAEKEGRASGRPVPAKKFEVIYPEDEDGVRAVFQEVGSNAPFNAPRGPKSDLDRRRSEHQPLPPPQPTTDTATRRDQDKNFATLDQLFDSTVAKPKLYYLPVSDVIAQRREDELRDETSRDWRPEVRGRGRGQGSLDQKLRFSFDAEDRVVEVGDDFGPWADDGGNRGRRGGRGGRGGFRSERGGGDRYRGPGARGGWRG